VILKTYSREEFVSCLAREPRQFYVYVLKDSTFYVGKGTIKKTGVPQRALKHEKEASRRRTCKSKVAKHIRKLWTAGLEVRYTIWFSTNSEYLALFEEQVLIEQLRRKIHGGTLVNLTEGGQGMSGYTLSKYTRGKMSATRTGRKQSLLHNKAISEGRGKSLRVKADQERRKIPVLINGVHYPSILEGARRIGTSPSVLHYRFNTNKLGYEKLA
jgi:hypothetical protein